MLKHSSAYAYHSSALQLIDAQIKWKSWSNVCFVWTYVLSKRRSCV
jgi:hypothetical protein